MSSKMADLQKVLPAGVQLVTFTVDPDRDDLNVLGRIRSSFRGRSRTMVFVRADKPTLYKLVFEGFKLPMMEDPSAESGFRVTHSTKFVLVDGQGRIRRYFESSDENMNASIRGANALLKETS
jgi:cytochrome oxidase Cu insertion factor (SCO1/SenC/PrrC family)